jgi:hypothetical protein
MKNYVHSLVHTLRDTGDLEARGLSDCAEGSCKDLTPCKKISKIGFGWMKETLDFSFLSFYSF